MAAAVRIWQQHTWGENKRGSWYVKSNILTHMLVNKLKETALTYKLQTAAPAEPQPVLSARTACAAPPSTCGRSLSGSPHMFSLLIKSDKPYCVYSVCLTFSSDHLHWETSDIQVPAECLVIMNSTFLVRGFCGILRMKESQHICKPGISLVESGSVNLVGGGKD